MQVNQTTDHFKDSSIDSFSLLKLLSNTRERKGRKLPLNILIVHLLLTLHVPVLSSQLPDQ